MKKLYKYLSDYKKECILGPSFKLLEATFELLIPLIVASIVDIGINKGDTTYIINMSLLMIGLGTVGFICSITAQYFAAKAATGFSTKLRHSLLKHIQSLSYKEIDSISVSTLITRMTSDVNQVQTGINLALRLLLRSPFVVLGAAIMAFTIDFHLALIFAVLIPALCIVVFGIMLYTIPLYKKVQKNLDKVTKATRENLNGVRVLRAFCKEDDEVKSFQDNTKSLNIIQKFSSKISALMNPVSLIFVNAAVIVLIYSGSFSVNLGTLTQGEVLALYNYLSQILIELIKTADLIITMTKASACADRVSSVLEVKSSELKDGKSTLENTDIEFKNVSLKYYEGSDESLSGINFKVKKGQTVGVIGGTGSGKTSLVNLIPSFYKCTFGEVTIGNINVNDIDKDYLRSIISVVPQKAVLFSGTVESNLKWGNENANEEEMYKALELSQAKEIVDSKDGLKTVVDEGGRNFSGGQKQRLCIARALVKKSEILILDDSASALDYATDAKLRTSIANLENKPTTFIVSQRASSVKNADIILVLEDGRLVAKGSHEELIESCSVYSEIYYTQFPREERV